MRLYFAVFVASCVGLLTIPTAVGLSSGINMRSDTILDRLANGMSQIKASSLAELHQLEDKDHTTRTELVGVLLDLEELFSKQKIQTDRQTDAVSELTHDVVPTLENMIGQENEIKEQTTQQLETAKEEMENAVKEATENMRSILTDLDEMTSLSQQAGEVAHNSDLLSHAASQFALISSRQNYQGQQLETKCKNRQELTSIVGSLLSHLQQARDQELGHIEKVTSDYNAFVVDVDNILLTHQAGNYTEKLKQARLSLTAEQAKLSALTAAQNDTHDKIDRVTKYKDFLGGQIAQRFKTLLEIVSLADLVIQQVDLLQIKLQVRAVTSA